MKKTLIAIALSLVAVASMAAEVSVDAVRDYRSGSNGARVLLSAGSVYGVTPLVSATRVNNQYTRYAAGAKLDLASVGPVTLSGVATTVYQDSVAGRSGYGLTAGVGANVALTKNIDLVASVERFAGQQRVSSRNGAVVAVGLNVKF